MAGPLRLILLLLLATAIAPAPAEADPLEGGPLVVGSELDYPPLAMVGPDGRPTGFSVELIEAIGRAMGLQLQFKVGPWGDLLEGGREGRIDILPNVAWSEQRDAYLDFTVPHTFQSAGIFVRVGSGIRHASDVPGNRVIVMRDDAAHEYVLRQGWDGGLILAQTLTEAMERLSAGEGDCVVAGRLMGLQTLQAMHATDIRLLSESLPDSDVRFCLAVPTGRHDLLAKLNEGLAQVRASGEFDAIHERWLGIYEPHRISREDVLRIVALLLGAFVLVLSLLLLRQYALARRIRAQQGQLQKLSGIMEQMTTTVVITDERGTIEYVNPAFEQHTGYSRQEAMGKNPRLLKSGLMPQGVYADMWRTLASGRTWRGELLNRRRNGTLFWELAVISPIHDEHGRVRYFAVKENITARKEMEEQLRLAATTDRLTGLPNRALLMASLREAIEAHRSEGRSFAVLFLDFDRFKIVNDSLGHHCGDELLKQIAQRLRSAFDGAKLTAVPAGAACVVSRLGGDEFVVLLQDLPSPTSAMSAANQLLHILARPYEIDGRELTATASIGVLTSDVGVESADAVLRDADTAMYEAKRAGKGCAVAFDQSMRQRVLSHLTLEHDLRRAVEEGQLLLMYQPIVCLRTGDLHAVEALVRWRHPTRGLIAPGQFIPVAEDTGQIIRIGEWVLHEACRQFAHWRQTLGEQAPAAINVNLSRAQLMLPELPDTLTQILASHDIPASCLHLEVTENIVMHDLETVAERLRALRTLGVKLDLDDFGTGCSSLASLHQFPVDVLKIDRSFVSSLEGERARELMALVHAVADLARNLGVSLVMEGIETAEQLMILQSLDCDYGQGYLFSPPVEADEVPWLDLGQHRSLGSAA